MSRIAATFARLKKEGRKALIPFFTAGDPDRESCVPLMLWWLPIGEHAVHTEPISSSPAELRVRVGFPFSLALAGGFALVGWSLLRLTRDGARHASPEALLGGVVAGVLLTALSFLGREVSSPIPFVSLSPIPPLNAGLIGFISGFAGPGLLLGLLRRVSQALGAVAPDEPDHRGKPSRVAAAPGSWQRHPMVTAETQTRPAPEA